MDSQHRHDLQDNWLAHRLEVGIEAAKPHLPLMLGVAAAVAIGVWGLGVYLSSDQTAREASWDSYAVALGGRSPNLSTLKRVVEDHAGSAAASWADITYADGQLYVAAQNLLASGDAASKPLEEAKSRYQRLRGAEDRRVRNRATFGLARVAELEGDLDEAKKLYGQVAGGFKQIAERRAEELAEARAVADYAWLTTVRPSASGGAATGRLPDFSVDAIDTPPADAATDTADLPTGEESIDDILKSIGAADSDSDSDSDQPQPSGSEPQADTPSEQE